jgi:serine/threonine-protein kinase
LILNGIISIFVENQASGMIGKTISHYKVLEKLGEGGMGVVYRAEDLKLKRVVAIKVLPARLSVHGEERERFVHEAQAASALNHPNICTIHAIDEADGESFIVMEYMDGITLREWIRRRSAQPEGFRKQGIRDAVDIAVQVAEGLEQAHDRGIVHRDVKSENVMVMEDGRAKIMDFGLAKLKGVSKLTKTGSTVGTIAYMSPEQVEGIETDHRTDIFSLGVVLYEMFAGQLPFRAVHEAAMMYEIINVEPPPIVDPSRGIDAELNRIVMKCLEKDRESRYQSMREVAVDLKRYRRDSTGRRIETKPEAPAAPPAGRRTPAWKFIAAAAALIAVGAAAWFAVPALRGTTGDSRIESIAVLPFRNASGDQANDYLSDGITENLINSLSRLKQFRVIPRSTAFHYKGKEEDAQKIGAELKVRVVLSGRVILNGDDLNIQAELIDIESQSQLWGEQYVRKKSDLLNVQDELSRAIAGQLHLTGEERSSLIKHSTENTDAYQLYLKGRYYWDKRSVDGFSKALQYFQQALDIDPNYALAQAGVADCYDLLGLGIYNGLPPEESYPKAKAAIDRAFQLDSNLAEAYTIRGHMNHSYEWDWARAESDFQRAIELNPKYATGHVFYAVCLNAMGRRAEATEQFRLGQQLEPLSLPINTWYGMCSYYLRDYDRAIAQIRKTLDIDASFANAYLMRGWMYAAKGMFPSAVADFRTGRKLTGDNPVMISALVYALSRGGQRAEASALLDTLTAMSERRFISPYNLAIAYAGTGDKEKFYHWLERAIDEHSFMVSVGVLRVDPVFDFVRKEQRFIDLFKRTGLPPLADTD